MGVATGCGCKEVYRFPHTIYLSLLLLYLFFLQQQPYFFVIKFYVLNNFFTQYKHTYGQLRASHSSHMKAAHTVLYMK